MRSSTALAATDDAGVYSVTCTDDHRRWSSVEAPTTRGLVLVRSGVFAVRSRGREAFAEPTTAYLQHPDHDVQFAHPLGGDVCTSVTVSNDFWQANFAAAAAHTVPVDARLETAHLMLLRAATSGDLHYAFIERLLTLIGYAMRANHPAVNSAAASTRLVRTAQEAILADDPRSRSLVDLARHLSVSPYHLSRVFSTQTGTGLTRYRNRIRISRVLHRLHDGDEDLAKLAIELGFSDQAHLTRTVTRHIGQPPAVLRRALHPETKRSADRI